MRNGNKNLMEKDNFLIISKIIIINDNDNNNDEDDMFMNNIIRWGEWDWLVKMKIMKIKSKWWL